MTFPAARALTDGCVIPTREAISSCVRPQACNSRMRTCHGIGATIDTPIVLRNRHAYQQYLSGGDHRKMENIGKRIEALRLARGWSQKQAATELHIAQPSLSAIESGESKSIKGATLARLCQVFHTTAEFVMFGAEQGDDAELALIEGEMLFMLRSLTPEKRQTVLESVRGIFNAQAKANMNNPYAASPPPAAMKQSTTKRT